MTESVYEWKTDNSVLNGEKTADDSSFCDDPLGAFLYALKSSEAKRQYPARLMKFFDYLETASDSFPIA